MEAVGARLGRSSTRYGGPSTVFSGPVRRWKKKWVHVTPSSSSSSSTPASNGVRDNQIRSGSDLGNGVNGNNGSHVMLYKWTPIAQREREGSVAVTPGREEEEGGVDGVEEPPRRKMKYIPIALLEEQKNESQDQTEEEEINAIEEDPRADEPASISIVADEKPDINDTPMKESEDEDGGKEELQDLNQTTLDLSLGLTSHDEEDGSKSKTDEE